MIATFLSFIAGIFLGDLIHPDIWWLMGIGAGILLTLILQWREKKWRLGLLIALGFIVGLSYFNFWDNHQKTIKLSYGQEQAIEGQIVGHPDISGAEANYTLKFNGTKIKLVTGRYPEYSYGDVLRFKASIKKPSPYLFHQGILGQAQPQATPEKIGYRGNRVMSIIYVARDKFEASLNQALAEPYASFAAGLVLGSKSNMPSSLIADFNRTGTSHIIAVSGYNVTIVVCWLAVIFGILSRRLKFWGTLGVIISFVIMTGASASVVRAGILAGLVAWGHFEGRRINMLILLLLTATIMLFFNPYALKYDLSFILSFLAFIGLVYFSPIIANLKILKILPPLFKNPLAETLGAQIMVLPILIFAFGRLSIISPIVNILILWMIPLAMAVILTTGIAGLMWVGLGQLVGNLAWLFLKYIIVIVQFFSGLSWASWQMKTSEWWWMIIFYAVIGLIVFRYRPKIKESIETIY